MPQIVTWRLRDVGLIDYDQAYALQKQCVTEVLETANPTCILCEHPTVLTLGRLTKDSNILAREEELRQSGITVRRIDRGGDITLHAPGQLVVYPIIDLGKFGKDLRRYLRALEQVGIELLRSFDILANRFPGRTGVWVGERKIASIGVGVRKWVTFHGLAVNVNTDLKLFSLIRPCDLDVTMTSIAQIKGAPIDMSIAKEKMKEAIIRNFRMEYEVQEP